MACDSRGFQMTSVKLLCFAIAILIVLPSIAFGGDVPDDLQKLYDQGKLDQAIEQAKQEMEKRKRSVEFPYFIGICYEKKKNLKAAEEYYQKALKIKDSHLPTLYRYGKFLVQDSTRLEEAVTLFEEGLKKAKKDHEKAMFEDGLGLYYLATGDYKEADKKFRTAQFLNPEVCAYSMHLGDANYEKGAFASAITSYNKILEDCDSTDAEVHFRLGRSYLSQKQYGQALDELSNAIRFDSSYVDAYNLAGKIYILWAMSSTSDQEVAVKRYGNSIWMFRKYIELASSEGGEANYYLAKAYQALRIHDSAAVNYEIAIENGYDRPDLYLDLGTVYTKSEKFEEAIEALSRYEQNRLAEDQNYEWTKEEAPLFLERARAYAGLDDSLSRVKGAEDFERAWHLDSTDVTWLNDMGFNYYHLGKFDSTQYTKALEVFERKIAIDTLNPRSWLNASYALMRIKDWDRTAEYLKKVQMLDSTNCAVNKLIASSLSQQKKYDESRHYYQLWGECDTTTYEAEKWIGFTYLIAKPPEGLKAVTHLKKAYDQMKALGGGECDDKDLITWIAQGYTLGKKYKEAMPWINKGLKCDPGNKTLQELKTSVEDALEAY